MLIIEKPELLLAMKSPQSYKSIRTWGVPGFKPWSIEEAVRETEIGEDILDQLVELPKKPNHVYSRLWR